MPKTSAVIVVLLAGNLAAGSARAQQLPAPAPVPGNSATKRPPNATPVVEIPETPVPGNNDDVIELDPPVRHSTPTPTQPPQNVSYVNVGGIDITGLKDAPATRKLKDAFTSKLETLVTLSDGHKTLKISRFQLGASIPYLALIAEARSIGYVPIRFVVDIKKAEATLTSIRSQIDQPLRAISLDVENGQVVMRGGDGVTLATEGSAWRVKEALEAQPPRPEVELVVQRKTGGAGEAKLSQFRYLLGSFSTPYDAGIRGRTNNLRMAARHVDGTIVASGKTFSANKAIGPRNAEAGWREAKMFVNGQVVNGVGAGICQCSTTVYNAALLAGLPIVERHPHSFRVTYAPASRDAAIYWGSKDMRFRNDTDGDIYVQTFLEGGRFHARLYGTEPPKHRDVEVKSVTLSRGAGTRSEAYRVFKTAGGGEDKQLLSRDYYKPKP